MGLFTAFDHTGNYRSDERHGEGVIDVEFEGGLGIVMAVVWKDIEECPYEIEALAGDIGDLKNGAYSLAYELGLG